MISLHDSAGVRSQSADYELKLVLLGNKATIWRRLLVPGEARLDWLHAVFQVAMGWTNSHLHQFKVGEKSYSDTSHFQAEFVGDEEILEERDIKLSQIAPREGVELGYEYDFGDSWDHRVVVEKIRPAGRTPTKAAVCLNGARACPPEDCGGIPGYDELLKILKKPKHPEHQSTKEWLGRAFDPEIFDVPRTNLWLRKLKWPHVTEAQLRRVLMGRDGLPPA